jgi:hypothetical protein
MLGLAALFARRSVSRPSAGKLAMEICSPHGQFLHADSGIRFSCFVEQFLMVLHGFRMRIGCYSVLLGGSSSEANGDGVRGIV